MVLSDIDLSAYSSHFSGYTELRLQENRNMRQILLNGDLVTNSRSNRLGASARCWNQGQWGFASSADLTADTLGGLVSNATGNASFLASKSIGDYKPLPETQFTVYKDLTTVKPRQTPAELIDFLRTLDDLPSLVSHNRMIDHVPFYV